MLLISKGTIVPKRRNLPVLLNVFGTDTIVEFFVVVDIVINAVDGQKALDVRLEVSQRYCSNAIGTVDRERRHLPAGRTSVSLVQ